MLHNLDYCSHAWQDLWLTLGSDKSTAKTMTGMFNLLDLSNNQNRLFSGVRESKLGVQTL